MHAGGGDNMDRAASLVGLPTELIQHVLAHLEPPDVVRCSQTCRRLHVCSRDDSIWQPLVNANLAVPVAAPHPAKSFRELYAAHHPHWFLAQQRIWFGDSEPSGKLLVARYDAASGCIVAHAVVASRGTHSLSFWEKDRKVIIHSFDPCVSLDLNQPVVHLGVDSPKTDRSSNDAPTNARDAPSPDWGKEVLMDTFADSGLYASLMLCRTLPGEAISDSTHVWPPLRFPAASRTRNESQDRYTSRGHQPGRLSDISTNNFRLRKWVEYTGRKAGPFSSGRSLSAALGIDMPYFGGTSLRMPEDITTYSSLPSSCYTPTPHKPWQGIYCGDYSGHGCEFLVITQPDKADERPLPTGMDWLRDWFGGGRRGSGSSIASFVSAMETLENDTIDINDTSNDAAADNTALHLISSKVRDTFDPSDVPTGRIEAIKLTGDPNIPRGEYTFIAPDIGPAGFVRFADESIFRSGSRMPRIVRSAGHIAGRGFRQDQYTPSQLIMISHDRLAQYWEGFGHISYYQRVDLDALIRA